MQIVIDIPEDVYTRLFDNGKSNTMDILRACVAIRKGTILPKHGRLIDADALKDELYNPVTGELVKIAWSDIRLAPTIIEADGGDAE